MTPLILSLLLAPNAEAGEIVVAMQLPVMVFVDGELQQPLPGSSQVKARGLGDGTHLVEIRNALNKPVTELTVDMRQDEEVRLRYAQKSLTEIGRGASKGADASEPEATAAAPSSPQAGDPAAALAAQQAALAAQQAQLSAMSSGSFSNASLGAAVETQQTGSAAGGPSGTTTTTQVNAGGISMSVTVTETSSGGAALLGAGPAANGLPGGGSGGMNQNSTAFVGLDPMAFNIYVDGRPLPWVDALGGFVVTQLPMGSKHSFRLTLGGVDALTADMTVDTRGHDVCFVQTMSFSFDIQCSPAGVPSYTTADLGRLQGGAVMPGVALGHTVPMGVVAQAPAPAGPQAMADSDFNRLLKTVQDESFSSDQVDIISTAARNNHFTCAQVARLIEPISFGSDQVKAVQAARSAIIDPNNAHELEAVFTFSSDKEKVRALFQ